MLPFTVFALFSGFLKIQAKLIRVNEWQEIAIDGSDDANEDALVDFHLFATCEKFSVLFSTERHESTRLGFSFDDAALKKIDVESVGTAVEIPDTRRMMGTCREKNRKILRVKVKTSNDSITFKIDDQLIRRPYDASERRIRILIPQSVACCLIRALFLSNQDLAAYSSTSAKYKSIRLNLSEDVRENRLVTSTAAATTFTPSESTMTTTTSSTEPPEDDDDDTNQWSKFTLGKNPTVSSTSKPKPESSWTHAVNKEWSITFVLCSIIICTIMLFLAVFGTFTVFYLMTKPRDGKSPFAVDA